MQLRCVMEIGTANAAATDKFAKFISYLNFAVLQQSVFAVRYTYDSDKTILYPLESRKVDAKEYSLLGRKFLLFYHFAFLLNCVLYP